MLVFQRRLVVCGLGSVALGVRAVLLYYESTRVHLNIFDMMLVLQRRLVVFGLGSVALGVRAMLFVLLEAPGYLNVRQ